MTEDAIVVTTRQPDGLALDTYKIISTKVIEEEDPTETDEVPETGKPDEPVQTGDALMAAASLLIAAITGAVLTAKKH